MQMQTQRKDPSLNHGNAVSKVFFVSVKVIEIEQRVLL